MSEKLYPSLQPQLNDVEQHLNLRLKEINSFNHSIRNEDNKKFFNHEGRKNKNKSKTFKIINAIINSVDGVLILSVSSTCVTLSITGVGLVVVPIARGIGAGLCIFSKTAGEYLKGKEQHNI